eukprot:RCo039987
MSDLRALLPPSRPSRLFLEALDCEPGGAFAVASLHQVYDGWQALPTTLREGQELLHVLQALLCRAETLGRYARERLHVGHWSTVEECWRAVLQHSCGVHCVLASRHWKLPP